jgi:hypothetical protein
MARPNGPPAHAFAPFVRVTAGSLCSREPRHERVAPGTSPTVETLYETTARVEIVDEAPAFLSTPERRARFQTKGQELETLVGVVAQGEHWSSRDRPPSFYSGGYVLRLIAHLTMADEAPTRSEIGLLQAYHRDGFSWTEERDWVREVAANDVGFTRVAPDFFLAACRHDQAEGTSIAEALVQLINELSTLVIDADGGEHPKEHLLRLDVQSVLLTAMRASLGQMGESEK